jgi:hypothetical protein
LDVARVLNLLGKVFLDLNLFEKARDHLERSLRITEVKLGPNDSQVGLVRGEEGEGGRDREGGREGGIGTEGGREGGREEGEGGRGKIDHLEYFNGWLLERRERERR